MFRKLLLALFFGGFVNIAYSQYNSNEISYIKYDTIRNGFLQMTLDSRMDSLLSLKQNRCSEIAEARRMASQKAHQENKPVSFSDLCRERPKMLGYRIQVLNSRSSEDAEKAKSRLMGQFPYLAVDIVYNRPYFKVMMGDYFEKSNAASDLTSVKKSYPSSLLVQTSIWCRRAK